MTTFLLALAVSIPLGFVAGVAVVWAVDNHRDRKWATESDNFTDLPEPIYAELLTEQLRDGLRDWGKGGAQ